MNPNLDKEKILENKLREKSLSIEEIKKYLCPQKDDILFAYISAFDRLGGNSSDIDIYIIGEKQPNIEMREKETHSIGMARLGQIVTDFEFWRKDFVKALIEKDYTTVSEEELKLLQRLKTAIVISNYQRGNDIQESISYAGLKSATEKFYRNRANSYLDDAVKLINDDYVELSLLCAREALQFTVGEVNSRNGNLNLKYKWIMRIYNDNAGYSSKNNLEKYKRYLFSIPTGCNLEKSYVAEILDFISELRTEEISIFEDDYT